MKVSSNRRIIFAKKWHSAASIFLILLIVVCVIFVGIIGKELIARAWGQTWSMPVPQQGTQTTIEPIIHQLIARVNDSTAFLHTTVAIIGVLVTLLSGALGATVLQTRRYNLRLIEDHFLNFKHEQLEPTFNSYRKELESFSTKGLKLMFEVSDILLDNLFHQVYDAYETNLRTKIIAEDERKQLLEQKKKSFIRSQLMTKALLKCLSEDEEIVQGGCQDLSALIKEGTVFPKADFILSYMRDRLKAWHPGTTVRKQIQDVIDVIERCRKNAS